MPRIVVRQFILAAALVTIYGLLIRAQGYWSWHGERQFGPLPLALLTWLPDVLMESLPIATAVSLALLPIRAGAFRTAAILVGAVTLFLVLNDTVLHEGWRRYHIWTARADSNEMARPVRFGDTTGVIGGAVAHLLGKVRPEDIQPWPPKRSADTTRFAPISDGREVVALSAALKFAQLTFFFLPFIGSGVVLGLGAWLRSAVTFRSARDERVFRLVAGWVLALGVSIFLVRIRQWMYGNTLSPTSWLAWYVAPLLVVGIPALVGWHSVRRLDSIGAA